MLELEECYRRLVAAVISQAVKDYRRVLKKKKTNIYDRMSRAEIESFFLSGWFAEISDLDGEMLMLKIREGIGV